MKKSEELEKLCPPPKPSEIAGLSLTATTAMVSGRYINGQVMTVAMWDGKKNPLIVWRFFGDYWTGVRRNKETYLPALRIENVCNELNRHSIPVTKEDDTKIRAYFCNVNYARIEDVIRYGQWQSNEKKKARREELREHGLKYWMSREPEEPKDFEQRIRRANSDIMLLWVGVETEIEVDTAGAHKIKVQKCHCDVCGADFKDYGPKWYAHKESVKCPKCGEELTVQLVRYGAKKKNTSRVFLFGQQSADGYWLKAYNVWFDYTSKRCTLDVTKREVYLLGPNIHYGYNYDWHGDYYYPVMRTTFAPESLFVGSMYTALIGADEKLVDELDDFMDMDYGGLFSKKNRKKYSLTSKLLLWRRTRQMPMAEGVLFEGNTMAASNGVIYAQAKIPYNIAEPFILPPNGVDLICGLDDPQVSIEKDGDNVKVAGAGKKRAKATLLTGTIDNFMRIAPPQQGMRNVSVDAEELIAAIKRVGYAVSLNPNRPAMTGIYFKAENGKLNLVGCDGSQLAKVEFPYEEDFHFILPNETAKSLAALDLHGQCQITGDHKKAVFSTEDYTLTTSLICGEYMNYESVIPKAGKYDVVFDRDSLLGAATRVKNLMDLKHREPVVLHIDGESCYITSRLTGVEFHEDVLCQGTIPEPMNIAFDDILLLNGISATKGEGIRALLNSSLSPMKIENEGFTALVLPVRMKNRA